MRVILEIVTYSILLFANNSLIYSQNCVSIKELNLLNWQGIKSDKIIDHVLKLHPLSLDEMGNTEYYFVIRTSINWISPVEYQISIIKKLPPRNEPYDEGKSTIIMVFQHPVGKSIQEQYKDILNNYPELSISEIANQINIKRDTISIKKDDDVYSYLYNIDSLSIPLIWPNYVIMHGTKCEVFVQSIQGINYSEFTFGLKEFELSNWIKELFKTTIEHFNAIDPYKD